MPRRVGEQGDRRVWRDLGERHDHPAAERLDPLEGRPGVLDVDVEGDGAVAAVLRGTEAGREPAVFAVHPVAPGVVRVEVPVERLAVEALEGRAVLAGGL